MVIFFFGGIILPYIFAAVNAGSNFQFNGFLVNPIDGYSYLAKMEQGKSGAWLYSLPFTVTQAKPQFLFEYYIFLGHISKWTGISTIWIFHIVRIINSGILIWAIAAFVKRFHQTARISAEFTWWLCIFGSGMGWVAALSGVMTSDMWVAEAYPFLASFTNPHFPLSIAFVLISILIWSDDKPNRRNLVLIGTAVLLSIIQPFCNVIVVIVLGIDWLLDLIQKKPSRSKLISLLLFGVCSLPLMGLYLWNVTFDPSLMEWNRQNVTAAPAFWDILLSFSPAILLAIISIVNGIKQKEEKQRILWIWVIVGLGICFIPINLQRRFLIGIYVPLTILAMDGLQSMIHKYKQNWIKNTYIFCVIPTNIIIICICIFGIISRNSNYYLASDEIDAFSWLGANIKPGEIVLTDSRTGLFLPAKTGAKVIYGHPFETPFADSMQLLADNCTSNWITAECEKLITDNQIRYILISPIIKTQMGESDLRKQNQVFLAGDVSIYAIK